MSDRGGTVKALVVTFFPMFIAALSLVTSMYNGYLNSKFVDIIQQNVGRGEYMRTCKEIIDAYFQVKFRASLVATAEPGARSSRQIEAENAVAKLAALGTYLANLRDERIRERYTELSHAVDRAVKEATTSPAAGMPKLFEPADVIFGEMNDDCVRSAKAAPM